MRSERPIYRYKRRCGDCRAPLSHEEYITGDRLCSGCVEARMKKLKNKGAVEPEPDSAETIVDPESYYE